MPPRKPKQPPRKAASKKVASKKTSPKGYPQDFNPETHILADDGKVYERKVVQATGTAVGVNQTQRTLAHEELERKMSLAVLQAHADGVTDPEEIRARILKTRDDHLG